MNGIQWTGRNLQAVLAFDQRVFSNWGDQAHIRTGDGACDTRQLDIGEWLIRWNENLYIVSEYLWPVVSTLLDENANLKAVLLHKAAEQNQAAQMPYELGEILTAIDQYSWPDGRNDIVVDLNDAKLAIKNAWVRGGAGNGLPGPDQCRELLELITEDAHLDPRGRRVAFVDDVRWHVERWAQRPGTRAESPAEPRTPSDAGPGPSEPSPEAPGGPQDAAPPVGEIRITLKPGTTAQDIYEAAYEAWANETWPFPAEFRKTEAVVQVIAENIAYRDQLTQIRNICHTTAANLSNARFITTNDLRDLLATISQAATDHNINQQTTP